MMKLLAGLAYLLPILALVVFAFRRSRSVRPSGEDPQNDNRWGGIGGGSDGG